MIPNDDPWDRLFEERKEVPGIGFWLAPSLNDEIFGDEEFLDEIEDEVRLWLGLEDEDE